MRKTPRQHGKRPLNRALGGKRPEAELASHLSVVYVAVSEAGKGVLYIGGLMAEASVGTCFCGTTAQQTRTDKGQRKKHMVLDVLASKDNCHPAARTSAVLLMACVGVWRLHKS